MHVQLCGKSIGHHGGEVVSLERSVREHCGDFLGAFNRRIG